MSVDKTDRNKLFLILGIGLFLRFLWVFMRWDWLQVIIYDDAFYYFAIAKMFVQTGMVSADGVTLTNGFHPLWLITVLPIWLLKLPDLVIPLRLVMVQAAVFDTLAAYLIFRLLLLHGQKAALWGAGLYFLNPAVLAQSMSGMETPLVAFLLVLWICSITRRWSWPILGLIGGLLFLARTDMFFLVCAGYIFLWFKDKRFSPAPVVTFLIALPWLFWNHITFGTIFQASGSTYPWIFKDEFINWFNYSYLSKEMLWKLGDLGSSSLQLVGCYFGGTIVFVALAVYLSKHFKSFDFKWALYGIATIIFVHTFIRWFPRIWYFHTLYIVILLMIAPFIANLSRRAKLCWLTVSLIGMIFVMGKIDGSAGVFARSYTTQKRAMVAVEMMRILVPHGSTVGAWNSGYPQYFAPDGITVINLDGLVNNEVIDYYRDGRFMEYCDMRGIGYIVDNSFFMKWSFGKYFEKDQHNRIKIINGPIENIGKRDNDMCLFKISPKEM